MRRDPAVPFSKQEERAVSELIRDYQALLSAREGQAARRLRKLGLPESALSHKGMHALSAVLLACCLLCLILVLPGFFRQAAKRPETKLYTVAPAAAVDRSAPAAEPEEDGGRIPINFAGKDELTQLPGVGPALAERIIEEREKNGVFRLPEDLLAVRGIGAATLQRLLPYISLQTPEP